MKLRFIKYGKGGSTSSTEVDVPESLKPYVTDMPNGALPHAADAFNAGLFGQPDKAGATTNAAWQSGMDYVNLMNNQINPESIQLFRDLYTPKVTSGDQLNAAINAATNPLKDQYARVVAPNIEDAALAAGGQGGSRQGIAEGLAKSELDKNILNLDATLRYQALVDDTNRALQGQVYAGQYLPTLRAGLAEPSTTLSNIGSQQDYFQNLQDKIALNNLLGYGDYIRQFIPGASSSTRQTTGGSKLGGALAGAGTGAMVGSSIGGAMASGAATGSMAGPWGAAIGAGVGALGSLLA